MALITYGRRGRLLDAFDAVSRPFFPEFRVLPPNRFRVRVGWTGRLAFNQAQFLESGADLTLDLFARGWLWDTANVIDIGSGCGRLAMRLYRTSKFQGTYLGVDVDLEMVRWCQENIHDERFTFAHADVYNSLYNPAGSRTPYLLPVQDASQDLVIAESLLTHVMEHEVRHYLSEAARVLRPGRIASMSVFCLEEHKAMSQPQGRWTFRHQEGNAYLENARMPGAAVAYRADFLQAAARQAGFSDVRIDPRYIQSRLVGIR